MQVSFPRQCWGNNSDLTAYRQDEPIELDSMPLPSALVDSDTDQEESQITISRRRDEQPSLRKGVRASGSVRGEFELTSRFYRVPRICTSLSVGPQRPITTTVDERVLDLLSLAVHRVREVWAAMVHPTGLALSSSRLQRLARRMTSQSNPVHLR